MKRHYALLLPCYNASIDLAVTVKSRKCVLVAESFMAMFFCCSKELLPFYNCKFLRVLWHPNQVDDVLSSPIN